MEIKTLKKLGLSNKVGPTSHIHRLFYGSYQEHFSIIIDKDNWPLNSPDLSPLDYSKWDEFMKQMPWIIFNIKKKRLISELKEAVKRMRNYTITESYLSWSKNSHRITGIIWIN